MFKRKKPDNQNKLMNPRSYKPIMEPFQSLTITKLFKVVLWKVFNSEIRDFISNILILLPLLPSFNSFLTMNYILKKSKCIIYMNYQPKKNKVINILLIFQVLIYMVIYSMCCFNG